jgi:hypothetical protein
MLSEGLLLKFNSHPHQLADTLLHQHGFIGRDTCVVKASWPAAQREDGLWGGPLVKSSWASASRRPELDIINSVREFAIKHDHSSVLNCLLEVLRSEGWTLLLEGLIRLLNGKHVLRITVQNKLFPIENPSPNLRNHFKNLHM